MPEEPSTPPRPADGAALIRAMHARYAGRWYRTIRFKQTIAWPGEPGRPPEVWAEYAELPGSLRIDFGEGYTGSGVLYAEGRRHVFSDGALVAAPERRSHLILLSFDAYVQPVEETVRALAEDGFDLAKVREDTWEGAPVYVVGADADDLRAPQFWVERERLVPVRVVEPWPDEPSRTVDVRMRGYRPAGGGWIAPEIDFLLDGALAMREDYFDIVADVEFPPGFFDPVRWSEAAG